MHTFVTNWLLACELWEGWAPSDATAKLWRDRLLQYPSDVVYDAIRQHRSEPDGKWAEPSLPAVCLICRSRAHDAAIVASQRRRAEERAETESEQMEVAAMVERVFASATPEQVEAAAASVPSCFARGSRFWRVAVAQHIDTASNTNTLL